MDNPETLANNRWRKPKEWTIQEHWKQWAHETHDEDKQNKKHNIKKPKTMSNTNPTKNRR